MSSVTQITHAFHAIFDPADELARQTGFVQRECIGKLTGQRFAITLVLGLLQRGIVMMSDLSHFARHSGMTITAAGLQDRFTRAGAAFLEALLNRSIHVQLLSPYGLHSYYSKPRCWHSHVHMSLVGY